MCACVNVYIYIYIYQRVYVCLWVGCMCVSKCFQDFGIYKAICINTYTHKKIYMWVYIYIYIYIYSGGHNVQSGIVLSEKVGTTF